MASTPAHIGRYQILREIGAGGMGEVFLARDPTIDRELALKRVLLGRTSTEAAEFKQRLLREARAAGRLIHPHVVTLFDAGESDEGLYLAFEYVEGVDLGRRIRSQPPLTLGQALTLGRQVASALDYAHQQGIVHRDIKPSNILIGTRGEAKVADFGLAKLHGESMELTRSGSVVGSPQYMSPEQVRGEGLDGRSDLFSLGVVLYEMLTRLRPFGGQTISTLVYEILSKEPVDVAELHPGVTARLATLIRRMLAKDAAERPASAAEVERELATIQAETAPELLAASAVATGAAAQPTAPTPPMPPPGSGSSPHAPTQRLSQPVGTPPSIPAAPVPATSGAGLPVAERPTLVTPPATTPPSVPSTGTIPVPDQRVTVPSSAAPQPAVAQPAIAQPAVAQTVAAPPPTPSSIPTPTTAADSGKRRWVGPVAIAMVALVLLAVIAVGAWVFVPKLLTAFSGGGSGEAVAQVDPADLVDGGSEAGGAGPAIPGAGSAAGTDDAPKGGGGEVPGTENDGSTPSDPAMVDSPGDPSSGSASAEPSPPRSEPAGPATTSVPPPPATTPGSPPATEVPPAPTSPAPTSPAPTSPAPPVVSTPPVTPPAGPAANSPEARWNEAAQRAQRTLRGGRFLRFQVDPPTAHVRVWRRGEPRGYVLGQAADYALGDRDARTAELPSDGEYLINLVAQGYPDAVLRLEAAASNGSSPVVVQASLAAGGASAAIRVGRSVAFSGSPADAEVSVDGVPRGPASNWPGGLRAAGPRNLQLGPGQHTIRIEAPGYQPYEVTVVVRPNAPRKSQTIHYRLER